MTRESNKTNNFDKHSNISPIDINISKHIQTLIIFDVKKRYIYWFALDFNIYSDFCFVQNLILSSISSEFRFFLFEIRF